jgi:hypothetical protein
MAKEEAKDAKKVMVYRVWCPDGCSGAQLKKGLESIDKAKEAIWNHLRYSPKHMLNVDNTQNIMGTKVRIWYHDDGEVPAEQTYNILEEEMTQDDVVPNMADLLHGEARKDVPHGEARKKEKAIVAAPSGSSSDIKRYRQADMITMAAEAAVNAVNKDRAERGAAVILRPAGAKPIAPSSDDEDVVLMRKSQLKTIHDSIIRASSAATQAQNVCEAAGSSFGREALLLNRLASEITRQINTA